MEARRAKREAEVAERFAKVFPSSSSKPKPKRHKVSHNMFESEWEKV